MVPKKTVELDLPTLKGRKVNEGHSSPRIRIPYSMNFTGKTIVIPY